MLSLDSPRSSQALTQRLNSPSPSHAFAATPLHRSSSLGASGHARFPVNGRAHSELAGRVAQARLALIPAKGVVASHPMVPPSSPVDLAPNARGVKRAATSVLIPKRSHHFLRSSSEGVDSVKIGNQRRVELSRSLSSGKQVRIVKSASEVIGSAASRIHQSRNILDGLPLSKRARSVSEMRPWVIEFNDGDSLALTHMQRELLMISSDYFRVLWSGGYEESGKSVIRIEECAKEDIERSTNMLQDSRLVDSYDYSQIDELFELYHIANVYLFEQLQKSLSGAIVSLLQDRYRSSQEEAFEKALTFYQLVQRYGDNRFNDELQGFFSSCLCDAIEEDHRNQTDIFFQRLQRLSELPEDAPVLALDFCDSHVTDNALDLVCGFLPTITKLNLSGCPRLTRGCISSLRHLKSLQHLDLSFWRNSYPQQMLNYEDLLSLHQLPLVSLKLNRTRIKGEDLAALVFIRTLRDLSISGCMHLKDGDLSVVGRMHQLERLDISGNDWSGAGLQHLVSLRSLVYLNLSGCNKITGAGLVQVGNISSLWELDLTGCEGVTDEDLLHLAPLRRLHTLI